MRANQPFLLAALFALTCGVASSSEQNLAPSGTVRDLPENLRSGILPEALDRKTINSKFRKGMSEKELVEAFGAFTFRREEKEFAVLNYIFDPQAPLKEGNKYMAGFIIVMSGGKALRWDFILRSAPE